MINITIGNKSYEVSEANTDEEKKKGLQWRKELPDNQGMIFYYDPPQKVEMWMKDTLIPLDIVFFNEDQIAVGIVHANPKDETLYGFDNVSFVVEVNTDSGIKIGDELNFEDDDDSTVMKVLAPDGSTQMSLFGGERIVSRRETLILIKKAKKAKNSNKDSDYKSLGRYIFKVFKNQDNRNPEYVDGPDTKESN